MKCVSFKSFVVLLLSLLMVTGCRQEDIRPQKESDGMGRIVLSLSNSDVYLDIGTRVETNLVDFTGYVFTLIKDGEESGKTIDFEDGTYILEAGIYKLKVDNWDISGKGTMAPYYSKTSEPFEVKAGEMTPVEIKLGKPKNAMVTVEVDQTFQDRYILEKFSLDGREVKDDISGPLYFAVPEGGKLSYALSAKAKSEKHITDITSAGGSIEIASGYHTTLTLKATPVSGELIPVIDGDYDSEFD